VGANITRRSISKRLDAGAAATAAPTPHPTGVQKVGAVAAWLQRVRLRHWIHFLPAPLATFDPHAPSGSALFAAGRGVASAFTILAFGFLLNSVSDRQMDRDARKNPFVDPAAGEHRYSLAALLVVSLILATLSPWPAQLATLMCLLLGYVYSMGPRLKAIPIAGSLVNVGGFALLLFLGMRDTTLPPRFGYVVLVFASLLLQNQLIHEAADQLEDRAGGVETTWLTLGSRWTGVIAAFSGLAATFATTCLVPAIPLAAVVVLVGTAFAVAFPLLLAWRGQESNQAALLRVTHRWCAVLLGAGLFTVWGWA